MGSKSYRFKFVDDVPSGIDHCVVGVCPTNRYYSGRRLRKVLSIAKQKFTKVDLLVAGALHRHNLPEQRIDKARANFQAACVLEEEWIEKNRPFIPESTEILRWSAYVTAPTFTEALRARFRRYASEEDFRKRVDADIAAHIEIKRKLGLSADLLRGRYYLLEEHAVNSSVFSTDDPAVILYPGPQPKSYVDIAGMKHVQFRCEH